MNLLQSGFTVFAVLFALYMAALLAISLLLVLFGWSTVNNYVSLRPLRDYRFVDQSTLSMPVTIVVPAFNEAEVIVQSITSLLNTQFTQLEIVIVNDGSTDDTVQVLIDAFALVPTQQVPRSGLATMPIRQVYRSAIDPRVSLLDKENGGKADALNAGINYGQYPLICAVDADTILDQGALGRLVWEFQADPATVATGGIVRIANGSTVQDGRIVAVSTPRGFLERVQIIEYLRAFLGGRLAWSRWNCLVIISGAFGLFRRDALVEIGGYNTRTVTEDAELILRLHRVHRDEGQPCRITFFPDPVCWTEAPSTWRQLALQRDRWQRGLGEALIDHRHMLFRRRYGRIGWIALPYYWFFEFLEPLVTLLGVIIAVVGLLLGFISPAVFVLLLAFTFAYGFFVSMIVLMIEQRAFRRYPGWSDLGRLGGTALLENFGFRQWQAIIRIRAMFRLRSHRGFWGEMQRRGFDDSPVSRRRAVH